MTVKHNKNNIIARRIRLLNELLERQCASIKLSSRDIQTAKERSKQAIQLGHSFHFASRAAHQVIANIMQNNLKTR